jgi:hypothetical protein
MEGRRIDISATQVIASLLAAVTGAIAASTLGVTGTIIGTAVMSVASTAIAGLYKHYIGRSRERLRKAAEAARASERAAAFRSRHGTVAGAHAASRTTIADLPATRTTAANVADDADKTQVFPAVAATQHRWQEADRANGVGRPDDATWTAGGLPDDATRTLGGLPDDATRTLGAAAGTTSAAELAGADRAGDTGNAGQPSGGGDESGPHEPNGAGPAKEAPSRPFWRRPLAMAGIAVGIFLLAMATITAIEAVAGKPLDALVGGKHSSGTTIGNLVGGNTSQTTSHHSGRSPVPTPSSTPTPSPSGTPSVSPSPSTSPSPTPTPAGTPSPTPSPSPTTGDTAGATTGAAARSPDAAHPSAAGAG